VGEMFGQAATRLNTVSEHEKPLLPLSPTGAVTARGTSPQ
jgi:hypothetical protein